MSKPIKKSEIAEKDVYANIIEGAKIALRTAEKLNAELKKTAQISNAAIAKTSKIGNANEIREVEKQMKIANLTKIQAQKLDTEMLKLNAKKLTAERQYKAALEKTTRAENKSTQAAKDQSNAYKILVKKQRDAKNESKRLGAELLELERKGQKNTRAYRALDKQYRRATTSARRFDKQLKRLDSRVGDNFRSVGNYSKALGGLRNGLAKLGLSMGVLQIGRSVFGTITKFEQATANLSAILGKTSDQVKELTDDARRLGGTTVFTAVQVAELQTEFAKFGFSTSEILNATEATLSLAAATGSDLARSAEIAASTLRGFGIDATESGRVTDVMAKSFSTSALDMEKFAESMKFVAPIAKVAGISLEETTAMLGALANAGISGSRAGTALRQVISEMDKTGKSTSEAIGDLAAKGLTLADANDEVGKNAKTALLVLTDQTEKVKELTGVYEKANGAAKEMADKQVNTLGGAVKLLNSAWDEQILKMNDAGSVADQLKVAIQFLANNLGSIISFLGKAIVALTTYKAIQIAVRIQQTLLNKELLKSIFSFKGLGKAVKTSSGEVSKMGSALRSIGFAVAIGLAIELAQGFFDIATGADKARAAQEHYNRSIEQGAKFGSDTVKIINDRIKAEKQQARLLLSEGKITEDEFRKRIKTTNDWADRRIKAEIQIANESKKRQKNDKAAVAAENATLKELIGLQKSLADQKIENTIANNNETKSTKSSTKATKEKTKAIDSLVSEYERWRDARVALSRTDESERDAIDQDLIINADEAIKQRRRNISEIKVLNAELFGSEEDLRQARIEQIRENLAIELEDIEKSETEKAKLKLQAELDIRQIEESANKKSFENQKELIDATADYFIKRSEEKIAQIDKEIDAAEKQFDHLQELAANGNIAAEQSLKEQQRLIVEANQKKLAEQKRIERIKLAETALSVYSEKVEAGDERPLASTITDISLLRAFIEALPSFDVGADRLDAKGQNIDGKGGFLAINHPDEQILTAEQNQRTGFMPAEEKTKIVESYLSGNLVNLKSDAATQIGGAWDMSPLINKLDSVESAINNIETSSVDVQGLTNSWITIANKIKKGNKTTINTFKTRYDV